MGYTVLYNFVKIFGVAIFIFALILANRWIAIGVLLGAILLFRSIHRVMNGYLVDDCKKNEMYFIVLYLGLFVILQSRRYFAFGEPIVWVNVVLLFLIPLVFFVVLHRVVLNVLFRGKDGKS